MALQLAVSASKVVLIVVGTGLAASVILRSGRLSDLIFQIRELLKGVNEVGISPQNYSTALLAAEIRQLAQEIRVLTGSSGSYASYIMPAAVLGAMGYCCMWWKGLSFSNVMFATKRNMTNAVATVSKQFGHVSKAVVSTEGHLSKRLENLDWKLEEQKETSKHIANDVHEVKSDLSQFGIDVGMTQQMVSGLEAKLEVMSSKQDMINSGLQYLCDVAAGRIKDGLNAKLFQDLFAGFADQSAVMGDDNSVKGLQVIVDTNESSTIEKSGIISKETNPNDGPAKKMSDCENKNMAHPVGISLTPGSHGSEL